MIASCCLKTFQTLNLSMESLFALRLTVFKQVMKMKARSSKRQTALTISCTFCVYSGKFCLHVFHRLSTGMAGHALSCQSQSLVS